MKYIWSFLFFFPALTPLFGQEKVILLTNPSFEDIPQHSRPPAGWYFCGPVGESPPDVHPNGYFFVEHEAHHGNTYVGMVTRDNGSWECIGQSLETPLIPGQCYQFSVYLAQSQSYQSFSRNSQEMSLFTTPVKLRIWGSTQNCNRAALLVESKAVNHEEWTMYTFIIQPKEQHTHLLLEAYYKTEKETPYNGNLLIDHAGPILPIDCTSHSPLIEVSAIQENWPNSRENLIQFLTEQGAKIHFTKTGLQLEQHLFKDQSGALHQTNQYLWVTAQAMQQFPKNKLIIAIRGTGELEIAERKFHLTHALQQAGLSRNQFKVKTLRRTDFKKKWLWDVADAEILMRVD